MPGAFGFYGKLPARGDFLKEAVPPGFLEPWDGWLQALLIRGRESLGDGWTERYMTAPIWRFVLAPGIAGPSAAIGVCAPSVDRVGRQFPLSIFAALDADISPLRCHGALADLFEDLDEIAFAAVAEDLPPEEMSARLAALELPEFAGMETEAQAGWTFLTDEAGGLAAEIGGATVAQSFRRPSIWTSAVPSGGFTHHLCEGFPDPADAARFFPPVPAMAPV